jgi:16S rRNA processing protein RimM
MDRVVIAEIMRPRGNRGELLARSQTDVPGRLESVRRAQARLAGGSDVPVEIVEAWAHRRSDKDDWVLKFAGVDSIDSAEAFRGADLWVPLAERGVLTAGLFFQSDLTGCQVVDRATGKCLGVVAGWQQYGGPPLMELQLMESARELLIPFVDAICQVDLAARIVSVDLPEGLLDL